MGETREHLSALDNIKSWIPIVLIIVSLIVGWTVMNQRIQQIQLEQALMTVKIEKFGLENVLVQVRLAEIQKDIAYIRLSLDEHTRSNP